MPLIFCQLDHYRLWNVIFRDGMKLLSSVVGFCHIFLTLGQIRRMKEGAKGFLNLLGRWRICSGGPWEQALSVMLLSESDTDSVLLPLLSTPSLQAQMRSFRSLQKPFQGVTVASGSIGKVLIFAYLALESYRWDFIGIYHWDLIYSFLLLFLTVLHHLASFWPWT